MAFVWRYFINQLKKNLSNSMTCENCGKRIIAMSNRKNIVMSVGMKKKKKLSENGGTTIRLEV